MALLTTQAAIKVRSRCILPPPNCLDLLQGKNCGARPLLPQRFSSHGLRCSAWWDLTCRLRAYLTGDSGRQLFPDFYPARLEGHQPRREIQDPSGCFVELDSTGMDVGDQISVGVGLSRARTIGHVGGEALCGCQSGTLPDQQHGHARPKEIADVIENPDATETYSEGLAQ